METEFAHLLQVVLTLDFGPNMHLAILSRHTLLVVSPVIQALSRGQLW
jgi:hypothetical protein